MAAARGLGDGSPPARWILRFHAITQNKPEQFDVDVDLAPGNWYVSLPAAGRSYRADLGPVDDAGHFAAACRSNMVHAPRPEASPHYGPRWMRVGGTSAECVSEPQTETAPAAGGSVAAVEDSKRPGPRRRRAAPDVLPSGEGDWQAGRDAAFEEQMEHAWPDAEAFWPPAAIPVIENISSFELGFRKEEGTRPEDPAEAGPQRRK